MEKACVIYKTKKEFKVNTLNLSDTGVFLASLNCFIIPIGADEEDLSKIIFEALTKSRSVNFEDAPNPKELLVTLREKSFSSLYKNSTSCSIYLQENKVSIVPKNYSNKSNSLVHDNDRKVEIENFSKLDLARQVIKLLSESSG